MTVSEILQLAGLHVDDFIDTVSGGMEWLNEGLVTLGANAMLFDTTTVDAAEAGKFYPLPADFIELAEVLNSDSEIYFNYDTRAGEIRFNDAGTYTVTYRRMPGRVASVEDTPEVHELFHPALALFVASRFQLKHNNDAAAGKLMGEFWTKVSETVKTLRHQARRPATIKVLREGY